MKSNADQTRMTMCDASAMSSQNRTLGTDHATTSATASMTSNAECAAIQKRLREIPPRTGCMRSGRLGQDGSTTMNSYKPPPRPTSASEAQMAVTGIRKCATAHPLLGAHHNNAAGIRFGSKSKSAKRHFRFTPESDTKCDKMDCPFWANSGHGSRTVGIN